MSRIEMAFISSLPLLRPPIRLSTTCPRPIRAPLHTAHKPMLCTHKEDPTEATYLLPTETDAQNGTSLQDVPPSTQPPPTPGIVQSTSDLDPRVLFGEFLSTFLFVYLSINATTNPSTLANALNNGAIIAAVAASFMPVSGAHLNPAVTLALLVTNRTSIKRAAVFIPLQLLAAVAAVSLAKVLGVSIVWNGVTGGRIDFVRAFVNELLPMFIIVVVVFQTAVATEREGGVGGKIAALYIGLAVLACAGTFTTGVFNPARAFGPAFVAGNFAGHWVHWVGPIVGATVAAFVSGSLMCVCFAMLT